jgi:hypothetical protein
MKISIEIMAGEMCNGLKCVMKKPVAIQNEREIENQEKIISIAENEMASM